MPGAEQKASPTPQRRRIRIRGLVQGVGFRPHVYRCASQWDISGFVSNDPEGVLIEAQGSELEAFIDTLLAQCPPLARIDSLIESPVPLQKDGSFTIAATTGGSANGAAIPADTAICDDCLYELFDPANRRYLHPFIACCHCGPRYSMARSLPYDRRTTTMSTFPLCPQCNHEYRDPGDRRFHAEPIACHDCGPNLGADVTGLAKLLHSGDIVAIKGLGGYHLACDAYNHDAVSRLRQRKQRDGKPFALMVLNGASASRQVTLGGTGLALLCSRERPVVVLPRREPPAQGDRALSPALSAGLDTLGVMLPYTAIHYLLFHALLDAPQGHSWLAQENPVALVMTSANLSGDPLIAGNEEAEQGLRGIADHILHHDREIAGRVDDSVVRAGPGLPLLIRRARGYAPHTIRLARALDTTLALGAHLKSTITMTRGELAHISPHVGDLDTPATQAFFARTTQTMQDSLQTKPRLLACDWSRDFPSTRLAEQLSESLQLPLVRVQHHHAHVAAVVAEYGVEEPVLGMALDGHGLGANGESWGGELLRLSGAGFQRLGHFAPLPLPGGDRAAREPWRMAAGVLSRLGRGAEINSRFAGEVLAAPLAQLLAADDIATTSAAGRLFDAAAGLLGISSHASYEGEAPMRLEALANPKGESAADYHLREGILDFLPLLDRLSDWGEPTSGATLFHATLITALTDWARQASEQTGIRLIALCGGCFLNRHLATQLPPRLESLGLRVLLPRLMPPGDGAISLGQAWVAQRSTTHTSTSDSHYD